MQRKLTHPLRVQRPIQNFKRVFHNVCMNVPNRRVPSRRVGESVCPSVRLSVPRLRHSLAGRLWIACKQQRGGIYIKFLEWQSPLGVGYELRKPSDRGNSVVLFLFGVFLLVVTNTTYNQDKAIKRRSDS